MSSSTDHVLTDELRAQRPEDEEAKSGSQGLRHRLRPLRQGGERMLKAGW
jgi:hypothetical protein